MKYRCLSIAGFDGSGGAGIQADLKVFSALGCYGMTVLTALPVQNTCGVLNCYELPLSSIAEQLDAIFTDIVPDSIKIGMLFSKEIIELVAIFLQNTAKNIPIVLDPVMFAKSGDVLLQHDAIDTLKNTLLPNVTLVTPNLPEAYVLANKNMTNSKILAQYILDLGVKAVLIKGGHSEDEKVCDFLLSHDIEAAITTLRVNTNNNHGTGCTLSAAITAALAHGYSLLESCKIAKNYLTKGLEAAKQISIGKGHGPVHHFHHFWPVNLTKFLL